MTDNTNTPAWRTLPGPWQDEANDDTWFAFGLRCHITRPSSEMGHWCGYVDIPNHHPWFRMSYDDINNKLASIDVHIHGGLSYGNVMDGYWRVGFDCAHAGDMVPGRKDWGGIYRTEEWVRAETRNLAGGIYFGFEDTTNDTTNTNESSTMNTTNTNESIQSMTRAVTMTSMNVLLDQAAQGQANLIQCLMGYINTLELRIAALEANQTSTDDEDEGPITRETISEMIGDRLEEFTSDYSFTSAVREIADEVVENIDWSSVIDAEAIVREGLRDIL